MSNDPKTSARLPSGRQLHSDEEILGVVANPLLSFNRTGLTAFAGGGQASATALADTINRVTVVATAGDSVKLPSANPSNVSLVLVINADSTDAMDVFPSTGDAINALSANTALSIVANKAVLFICVASGKWQSLLTA